MRWASPPVLIERGYGSAAAAFVEVELDGAVERDVAVEGDVVASAWAKLLQDEGYLMSGPGRTRTGSERGREYPALSSVE